MSCFKCFLWRKKNLSCLSKYVLHSMCKSISNNFKFHFKMKMFSLLFSLNFIFLRSSKTTQLSRNRSILLRWSVKKQNQSPSLCPCIGVGMMVFNIYQFKLVRFGCANLNMNTSVLFCPFSTICTVWFLHCLFSIVSHFRVGEKPEGFVRP